MVGGCGYTEQQSQWETEKKCRIDGCQISRSNNICF